MALRKLVLTLPVAALVAAGCQGNKNDDRQALEKRVQELEAQLAAASPSPSASPATGFTEMGRPEPGSVWPDGTGSAQAAPAPSAPSGEARPARRSVPRPPSMSRTARAERPRRAEPARTPSAERVEVISEPGDDDEVTIAGREGGVREPVEARPTRMVLPEGTELTLVLETALSSATSREGDQVVARVERAVGDDGRILLPGGTVLRGRVTEARASGRVQGRARLAVDFDRIVVRGRTHELDASPIVAEAQGQGGRDAKIIGGSAAGGAILGAITGGKKGATRGALIGAGAGTAAVLVTKGKEVELPSGSRWTIRVRDSVRL